MAIPSNKIELKQAISESYLKLKEELKNIPDDLTELKDLEGHAKDTQMSICNLVAYLVGWGELVLKWHDNHNNGLPLYLPDIGYKWNELGSLAQKFYLDYKMDDIHVLLSKLDDKVFKILKIVEEMDNDILYHKLWYKSYPFGRMIQLNTSSPYKNARTRIRKWKRVKGI